MWIKVTKELKYAASILGEFTPYPYSFGRDHLHDGPSIMFDGTYKRTPENERKEIATNLRIIKDSLDVMDEGEYKSLGLDMKKKMITKKAYLNWENSFLLK